MVTHLPGPDFAVKPALTGDTVVLRLLMICAPLAGGAGDHGEHRPGRVEEHCEPAHARDVHGGD